MKDPISTVTFTNTGGGAMTVQLQLGARNAEIRGVIRRVGARTVNTSAWPTGSQIRIT